MTDTPKTTRRPRAGRDQISLYGAAIAFDEWQFMAVSISGGQETTVLDVEKVEPFFDDLLAAEKWSEAERVLWLGVPEMARAVVLTIHQLSETRQ